MPKGKSKAQLPAATDTARAPEAPPVWHRVRCIRRHLEAGTWGPEVAAELEATWGLTPAVVRTHAAEAQRQREAVLDAGAAARQIEADIDAALQEAFTQGDMGAVQRLLETRLKLHGLGQHRDPKNDPKPEQKASADPSNLATTPPWERGKHKAAKPS